MRISRAAYPNNHKRARLWRAFLLRLLRNFQNLACIDQVGGCDIIGQADRIDLTFG